MQKWAYFTMGMMAGIIVLLLCALILQNHDNAAYAQGVDNDSRGLIMTTGGSTQQQQDILWVLHEHDPIPALRPPADQDEEAAKLRKNKRLSLLLYKCENGRAMKLISARDLSYDEELVDFNTEKPTYRDVYEDLKKEVKKNDKRK